MKKNIYLIILIFTFINCKKENQPEYPGSLIKHGLVNIVMPGSDINDPNMRMYAFSGNHQNDLSALPSGDWTYELWIKVDSMALIGNKDALAGVYAGGACIGDRRHIFELYLINDDDPDADFAIKYGALHNGDDLQVASMQSDQAAENLHFNEWIHVAICRSSADNTTRFFINGKLIDSSTSNVWKQPANDDTWLDFNYMYRGSPMFFFKGGMDLVRLSTICRYTQEFTPSRNEPYVVDENTLLQLNLDEHLTPFSPPNDFDKIEIKGFYDYYIKVHKDNTWYHEPDEYLPLGDY